MQEIQSLKAENLNEKGKGGSNGDEEAAELGAADLLEVGAHFL